MNAPTPLEVFINPGEFYFGEGHIRVSTLLGSCVSITLWHSLRRHGGMCHYMLDSRGIIMGGLDGKYADEAMELFMVELKKRKTHPAEYQVKMFGGGNMFRHTKKVISEDDIGSRNIAAGLHLLERYGFKLNAKHVGGFGHRRLLLDLWSGDAWMKFTDNAKACEVAR